MGEYKAYEDSEPVSGGCGWLSDPAVSGLFSPERQMLFAREASRAAKAAAEEEAERLAAAEDRQWMLDRKGCVAREHTQVLADYVTFADRQARKEARQAALEEEGQPVDEHWGLRPSKLAKLQEERAAAAEVEPATKADVGKLQQTITKLKAVVSGMGGKP